MLTHRRGLVEKRGSKDGGATTTGAGSGESNNNSGNGGGEGACSKPNGRSNTNPDDNNNSNNNNDEANEQQFNKSNSVATDVNNNNNENCFHHITMTSEDLLQPGHVVKERWKVVSNKSKYFMKWKCCSHSNIGFYIDTIDKWTVCFFVI